MRPPQTAKKRFQLTRLSVVAFTTLAVLIGGLSLSQSAWMQERKRATQSLSELEAEGKRKFLSSGQDLQKVEDSSLLYHLGKRFNEAQRFAEARAVLQQGVGIEPDSARLRDEWAKSLLGLGEISEAFAALKQFVGTYPRDIEGHLALTRFYLAQNAFEKAKGEAEAALSLDPHSGEAYKYLALIKREMRDAPGALLAAEKGVAELPQDSQAHLLYAIALVEKADTQKVRAAFLEAIRLDSRNEEAKREYAFWLLRVNGQPEALIEAEKMAREATILKPQDGLAYLTLGKALLRLNRTPEAVENLLKASEQERNNADVATSLASAYHSLGQKQEEILWRKRAFEWHDLRSKYLALYDKLAFSPDDRNLNLQMAEICARSGQVNETIRHFAKVRNAPSDAPAVLIASALALSANHHYKAALSLLNRTEKEGRYNPDWKEARGNVYLDEGRPEKAGDEFNSEMSLAPSRRSTVEKRLKEYSQNRAANPSEAERLYKEVRQKIESPSNRPEILPQMRQMMEKAADRKSVV